MATVDLFELRGSRARPVKVKRFNNMSADPRDADECRDLLRRLAKQHSIDPYSAELFVWEGRKKEFFRL